MLSNVSSENITYPAGKVPEDNETQDEAQRQPVMAKKTSVFFVSNKYESLNYVTILNQLEIEKEKSESFRSILKEDFMRILYFFIVGIFTAIIGVFILTGVFTVGEYKYTYLSSYIEKHHAGSGEEIALMTFLWFLGSIIPVMIGSSLVVFIAPFASGGGVAQCVAYLNGVRVPKVLSMTGFWVKALSTICCVTSGLAGGKEGPMMHMGAIIGGSLPSALPWETFKSDHERRDLAAAGFGAGVAVAFYAPVGGLLLALEEGISFWNIKLMWKTYLCIVLGYFVATILTTLIIKNNPGNLSDPELIIFGKISTQITRFELFELIFFAVMGVIGGLLGVVMIKIHIYFTTFRKRFVQTKIRKLTEAFLVACIAAGLPLMAFMYLRSCSVKKNDIPDDEKEYFHQMYCGEGEFSDMAFVALQHQEGVIRSMFSETQIHVAPLLVYSVIYFVLICFTMGLSISAGIFVPQIVLGAVWGRMFGTILSHMFPEAQWAKPAKYAYVGATAQLSSTVGKTFSILVIMIEASGSLGFSFPLMVVVSITKYVVNFFVMPIYETQVLLMGLPLLPSEPPPLSGSFSTSEVMSRPPLVTLPPKPTVNMITNILRSTPHNGFPIVGWSNEIGRSDCLLGLILRQQLLVLLKYKAYKYPLPTTPKQMVQCLELYLKNSRKQLKISEINVNRRYSEVVLDLNLYYNRYPFIVQETSPFTSTYSLFRSLGLRHIIVTNKKQEAVGMVTRKDLAKYHTWEKLCRSGVKEMLVKP